MVAAPVLWATPVRVQDRAGDAIAAAKNAVASAQKAVAGDDLRVATALIQLGDAYSARFIYKEQADMAYQYALSIYQKMLPADDTRIADLLIRLSAVSAIESRAAELLVKRALAIYAKQPPSNEAAIIQARYQLAGYLVAQRKYQEAEPLLIESIRHFEGTRKPEFASALRLYATVLEFTGRLTEASDMSKRSQAAFENMLHQ
jgi:hypothetical protein